MLRITEKEKREIARLKRNAKAKISRLQKKGVPSSLLPNIMPKQINTRAELNAYKTNLKRFTNRYNADAKYVKYGDVFVTMRQSIELERARNEVNRKERAIFNRNKNKPMRIISEERAKIPTTKRTVGQDRMKEKPLEYTKKKFASLEEIESYKNQLEKRIHNLSKSDQILTDNLKKAAISRFGEKGKMIVDALNKLSANKIIELFETTDILNFDVIYPSFYQSDTTDEELIDEILYVLNGE